MVLRALWMSTAIVPLACVGPRLFLGKNEAQRSQKREEPSGQRKARPRAVPRLKLAFRFRPNWKKSRWPLKKPLDSLAGACWRHRTNREDINCHAYVIVAR